MKKIIFALFVIAIATTQCSTPNPSTTSGSDTLNTNVNQKSPDTSMMRDTMMRRDTIK